MKKICSTLILALTIITTFSQTIEIKIKPEKLHSIDKRVFGHFLERPSWGGEFGIEDAVINDEGDIDPRVMKKLKQLYIPVLRFPGGTDVDFTDWTDMVDLQRRTNRPVTTGNGGDKVTNRFGYDEFAKLTEELDCEAIIPINFFDAFLKKQSLDSAALHHVGLLAYTNAKAGQKLPEGMKNWPEIRKQNGHKKPFNFKYFQIGNETWAAWEWRKELLENANLDNPHEWYVTCAEKYIDLIEQVDPEVKIIADYVNDELTKMLMEKLGDRIDYYVYHSYVPWEMNNENTEKNSEPVAIKTLGHQEAWNAMVSIPNAMNENNMSSMNRRPVFLARDHNLKLAVTEWNWNGWWSPKDEAPLESNYAQAVGAAGFLHGYIRTADVIDIACQSMLVGSTWGITGIRVDKKGEEEPYFMPTSQVTSFYGKHHGNHVLAADFDAVPFYNQPIKLAGIEPKEKVAVVDILPTGSERSLSVFFINRDFSEDHEISIDLSEFKSLKTNGEQVTITGILENTNANPPEKPYIQNISESVKIKNGVCKVVLPKRSVCVVKF